MKMLNRNGTRLFSPLKSIVAGVLLLLGLTASAVLIVIAVMSVKQTVAQAQEPAPIIGRSFVISALVSAQARAWPTR